MDDFEGFVRVLGVVAAAWGVVAMFLWWMWETGPSAGCMMLTGWALIIAGLITLLALLAYPGPVLLLIFVAVIALWIVTSQAPKPTGSG